MSYNVSTISSLYSESLTSKFDARIIELEGFYIDKQNRPYSSVYYDDLIDKSKQSRITIQVKQELKYKLVSGNYYQFQGFLNKGKKLNNDSRLPIYFHATKILKYEEDIQLISKSEYNLVKARYDKDSVFIDQMLIEKFEQQKTPVIDVILANKTTSFDDYQSQLYDTDFYSIRHHSCNFSSQTEILNFIETYDFSDSDLLVVLRGGGSGLEVFDNEQLCMRMIELPVPFITGIGHDEDTPLLQKVADRYFSTPTSVGVFLQKVVNQYKNRLEQLKAKDEKIFLIKERNQQEKAQLNDLIISEKQKKRKLFLVLTIVLIITALLIIFIINKVF